ncbi:MAG: DNA-formamidopyrimidine glycosylase family protein [Phycisphaerales bacterium]|jgi:formamidopyrimidine-DNA glycosylase
MPELPDIELYCEALRRRVVGHTAKSIIVKSVFLLRSVEPPVEAIEGRLVRGVWRLGKRVVVEFEGELFVVIHLMIAGRLRWADAPAPDFASPDAGPESAKVRVGLGANASGWSKIDLARIRFDSGTLTITEASQKKRAGLWVVAGREGLHEHDPGGVEPLTCTRAEFVATLTRENRTLKRALTNPHAFAGIGNAYSDEILHAARLSPIALTGKLRSEQLAHLHEATRDTLAMWAAKLKGEFLEPPPGRFPGPGDVTAFRPDFAVHGKFGQPCPVCGHKVQRIIYSENEVNYCPTCQTGGKVLADRSMSRLLGKDWPRTVEEWEA